VFLGMGRPVWKEARATLQKILSGYSFSTPPPLLAPAVRGRFDFSSLLQLIVLLDFHLELDLVGSCHYTETCM
jgi:hypothetical protein